MVTGYLRTKVLTKEEQSQLRVFSPFTVSRMLVPQRGVDADTVGAFAG